MFHMKSASVRDLRHDFPRVLAWIEAGEEVSITKRREEIARLVPSPRKAAKRTPVPDIAARLKKVFGTKMISEEAMESILRNSKGPF